MKSAFMAILVVVPISVTVFSQLSHFQVLRILEESFSVFYLVIIMVYVEIKFWGKDRILQDNLLQREVHDILRKYDTE